MKKRYFITYDLNKAGQDYENVIQAIKSASDGANYQSAQEVSDKITKYLDRNDSLLVIEVINNTQGWLPKDAWKYINETIFSG